MSLIFRKITKGRVLYSEGINLYKSVNGQILYSSNGGESWAVTYKIFCEERIKNILYRSHLINRLFRKGVHHFYPIDDNLFGIIYDKKIVILKDGKKMHEKRIKGSRPLSFEYIAGEFVFGEYRSNPERSGIGIFGISLQGNLSTKAEMTGIRHIHGIYQDPYTNKIWITTGDEDHEASIYCIDKEFKKMDLILTGSQQTRTIKLLFDEHFIYFGSDAPNETNHIYKLNRSTKHLTKLVQVGSSIFNGVKIKNWLFFSTVIEPSKINETKHVEIWASPNGDDWKCILKFKKDILSMRFFQYGQVFFPNTTKDNDDLWISLFATKKSNQSFSISLNQVQNLFDNG